MYEWCFFVAALWWLGGQLTEGQVLNSSQPIVCISGMKTVPVRNVCRPTSGEINFVQIAFITKTFT